MLGFDNHKQEVFNLVQALKMLFLYTQGEKDTVEEFGQNFEASRKWWKHSGDPQECIKTSLMGC
jgi:hypothetical protein